jgi:hypothetical protein
MGTKEDAARVLRSLVGSARSSRKVGDLAVDLALSHVVLMITVCVDACPRRNEWGGCEVDGSPRRRERAGVEGGTQL